jgi:hypothetical protein
MNNLFAAEAETPEEAKAKVVAGIRLWSRTATFYRDVKLTLQKSSTSAIPLMTEILDSDFFEPEEEEPDRLLSGDDFNLDIQQGNL